MPRPQRCRKICALPESQGFEPAVGKKECPGYTVYMSIDEYEVIRLIDLEGMTQEKCAGQMEIARTTVTGIYESARRKIADAIVNQKRLKIGGGNYRVCERQKEGCAGHGCPLNKCWRKAAERDADPTGR
ncbi:MAG: DUF134 domain-containing protein [Oscillospiraceae bacterium]|nr:DUF134 domain-containing protein [Oscillospiraceae bacterium]